MQKKEINTGLIMDSIKDIPENIKEKIDEIHEKAASEKDKENMAKQIALYKARHTTLVNDKKKIGRNEPCPCGSGKKFKNCCMGNGTYDSNLIDIKKLKA